MSDLVEYFVRHYTLVIDNEGAYNEARHAAREAIETEAPDLTLSQYEAMSAEQRRHAFADAIGANVLELIGAWTDEVIDESPYPEGIGALLIREVLITNGSDMAYALGEYYMPEDDDAAEWLPEDEDEDGEDAEVGHVSTTPGVACKSCASIGRLTWLDDDGSCRRRDAHRA